MARRIFVYLLIVFVPTLFLAPYAFISYHSQTYGKQEIQQIAKTLTANETDTKIMVNRMVDWVRGNMKWNSWGIYFWPIPPFLLLRQSPPSPEWVMTIKQGACEEHSILFVEIVKATGIAGRIAYDIGEDHVWSEVFINGSWIHVDPTLSFKDGFNNPQLYELPKSEGGWEKQISRVFYIDINSTKHDITNRYTNTGKLVVQVMKDSLPVQNALVTVESRFLMETNPQYKNPILCAEEYTNKSGLCEFELGGNNYTVAAQVGSIVGYSGESIVTVRENDTSFVSLSPDQPSWLLPTTETLILFVIIVLILGATITLLYMKRKRSNYINRMMSLMRL